MKRKYLSTIKQFFKNLKVKMEVIILQDMILLHYNAQ